MSGVLKTELQLSAQTAHFGYNPALDGLRALAIAGVVAEHGLYAAQGGYHGVTLFFVISGYLITSLLMTEYAKRGTIRFRHFYWRRFVRLGPALILLVLVTSGALALSRIPISQWWGGAVGSLTYTTDILIGFFKGPAVDNNFEFTWSLGIEEQFYLIWPLLLLLMLRWGKFVPTVLVLALGILVTWDFRNPPLAYSPNIFTWKAYDFGPFTHADALLWGCGIAVVLIRFHTTKFLRIVAYIVGPIGVIVMAVLYFDNDFPHQLDAYGIAAMASAGIVFWIALLPHGWFARFLALPPFVLIGKLSYGIYLWNLFALLVWHDIVGHWFPADYIWGVVWVVASVGLAFLSYRYVETPIRRRLAPPQSHAVVEDDVPAKESAPASA